MLAEVGGGGDESGLFGGAKCCWTSHSLLRDGKNDGLKGVMGDALKEGMKEDCVKERKKIALRKKRRKR